MHVLFEVYFSGFNINDNRNIKPTYNRLTRAH